MRIVRYDVTIIDTKLRRASDPVHPAIRVRCSSTACAATRPPDPRCPTSANRQTHPFDGSVQVNAETFAVALTSDNTVFHPDAAAFTSQAAARLHRPG